ncbi:MAG: cytochrome c4 [Betaproteobacteria bacterium]|nr:cytochrome c4 [Betaproteobacteria bacterium]
MLAAMAATGLLWAVLAAAQDAPKPDLARGEQLAKQVCAACHGADGNSVAPTNPKLSGQHAGYVYKQLANFKQQGGKKAARENAIMAGMVAILSDSDMRALAAYYAAQSLRPAVASDKDLAAKGQKLWRGGIAEKRVAACAGCHGPDGAGIPGQYPRLAGQFAEYVDAQLKLFRAGARANDPNGMMRGVVARMSDEEIEAVAEYAAGLR